MCRKYKDPEQFNDWENTLDLIYEIASEMNQKQLDTLYHAARCIEMGEPQRDALEYITQHISETPWLEDCP